MPLLPPLTVSFAQRAAMATERGRSTAADGWLAASRAFELRVARARQFSELRDRLDRVPDRQRARLSADSTRDVLRAAVPAPLPPPRAQVGCERLPDSVLCLALRFCAPAHVAGACYLVSRRWRAVARQPASAGPVWALTPQLAALATVAPHWLARLEDVRLRVDITLAAALDALAAAPGSRLRALRLDFQDDMPVTSGVAVAIASFVRLEEVSLSGFASLEPEVAAALFREGGPLRAIALAGVRLQALRGGAHDVWVVPSSLLRLAVVARCGPAGCLDLSRATRLRSLRGSAEILLDTVRALPNLASVTLVDTKEATCVLNSLPRLAEVVVGDYGRPHIFAIARVAPETAQRLALLDLRANVWRPYFPDPVPDTWPEFGLRLIGLGSHRDLQPLLRARCFPRLRCIVLPDVAASWLTVQELPPAGATPRVRPALALRFTRHAWELRRAAPGADERAPTPWSARQPILCAAAELLDVGVRGDALADAVETAMRARQDLSIVGSSAQADAPLAALRQDLAIAGSSAQADALLAAALEPPIAATRLEWPGVRVADVSSLRERWSSRISFA